MILFKKAETITAYLLQQKTAGLSIGFVPTMGALHHGHLSLIAASAKETGITVASIFVNPTQFTNADDFKHYPVTLEKDIESLLANGCDVLFLPSGEEVYPADHVSGIYDLGVLETILEGKYRPGHFQGVSQVVDRLLHIVQPDLLYLGMKDYQQCMVIDRLIKLLGMNEQIRLKVIPTAREKDGLAMSSRNLRLNTQQRKTAPALYKALVSAKEPPHSRSYEAITHRAVKALEEEGFMVDYFDIRDAQTLLPPDTGTRQLVALVAAHLDGIRLIDNLLLS